MTPKKIKKIESILREAIVHMDWKYQKQILDTLAEEDEAEWLSVVFSILPNLNK